MKFIEDFDVFYSPYNGERELEYQYILVGDYQGISTPSPYLKDLWNDFVKFKKNIATVNFIVQHEDRDTVPSAQVLDQLIPGMLRQDDGVISIQQLTHNYIWVGNEDNYPEESDTIPFSALPDLTYKKLWRGDSLNRPEEIIRTDLYNLPSFFTLSLIDPTSIPPGAPVNFGLHHLYTGGFNLDPLEPIAPTKTLRVDMSNLPNLKVGWLWMGKSVYTPPVITVDAIPPYIHVTGELNWDGRSALPPLPPFFDPDDYGVPVAVKTIEVDNLPDLLWNKIWVGDITDRPIESNLPAEALPDLTYLHLWQGDEDDRPIEILEIDTVNLPPLPYTKIWIGNESNRPEATQIIYMDNLPDLAYTFLWTGDVFDRPEAVQTIAVLNLPPLATDNIWIGDMDNRPMPRLTIGVINLPDLTFKNIWIGDAGNRPIETAVIYIENMPDLTLNKFWRGDSLNRPIEVTMTGIGGITIVHNPASTVVSGQLLQDQIDIINTHLSEIDTHLGVIDGQIVAIDTHLGLIDTHLAAIDVHLGAIDAQLVAIEAHLVGIDLHLAGIDISIAALTASVAAINVTLYTPVVGVVAVVNGLVIGLAAVVANVAIIDAQINDPITGIFARLDSVEDDVTYLYDHIGGLAELSDDDQTGILVLGGDNIYHTRTLIEGSAINIANDNGVAGNITIAVDDNPVFSGDSGITLPTGTTAQRSGGTGTIRFNTTTTAFEGTTDGSGWFTFNTTFATVTSVDISTSSAGVSVGGGAITSSGTLTVDLNSELQGLSTLSANGIVIRTGSGTYGSRVITGTAGKITVTDGDGIAGNPNITIDSAYIGQTSITTLGTITTGNWNGSVISIPYGGTGTASLTDHGILIGHGTSAITSSVLTNGQLLIGNTGNDPTAATLTAGTGIEITNGTGTITIQANDIPNNIVNQTSGTASLVTNKIYITNNGASLVTYTLPASAALGDYIEIVGNSSGGWKIAQNANQSIKYGKRTTTTGISGFLSSTLQYNCIKLRCIVAGTSTIYVVVSSIGNITYN
jgi:hypothetical protein